MEEGSNKKGKRRSADERQARLAEELRANLRKRKAKARAGNAPSRGAGKDTKKPE